ncbi:MAG: delta-lactam-biosynthetic de-N-acetylase [Epulopiscium sp.]|nr:delta-lactam-biosynthetic de-N-acetylase [Candidatus Epulonipiscium sp.]
MQKPMLELENTNKVEDKVTSIEDIEQQNNTSQKEDIDQQQEKINQENNKEQDQQENQQESQQSAEKVDSKENVVPNQTNKKVDTKQDQKSWWFKRNKEHLPPGAQQEIEIAKFNTYYLGDTAEKVIYLTFDEGYENGYTAQILDILKENDVQAAFFVTQPYVKQNLDLIQRMVNEGHVVGNHSVTHPNLTEKNDDQVKEEIQGLANYYEEVIGQPIAPFFRPPAGYYSERTLQITQNLGYKTIFWSMAYKDWVVDEQPGKEVAYQHVMDNHHPGAIILLHAVSKSNTEALDQILKDLKAEGYRFASLYDLP